MDVVTVERLDHVAHVQGVRLNHELFVGKATPAML